MSRSFFSLVLMCLVALWSLGAQAQEPKAEGGFSARPLVTAGYTSGGDTLVEVEFENGDKDKLKAGGAFLLGFGIEFVSADGELAVQLTANYHFDSINAENGEATFERYPIELVFFDQGEKHRYGAGFTVHLSPTAQVKADGGRRDSLNFDPAVGFLFEYNYLVGKGLWLGLRYTLIDYDTPGSFNSVTVDGNHFGLMAHFRF